MLSKVALVSLSVTNPPNCSALLCQFSRKISYISTPLYGSVKSTEWRSKTSWSRRMEVSSSSNMVPRASAQPLQNPDQLIGSVETFIFDCDGVIWKGDKLIDGVPETLDMLRSKGKRLVFVTNNSTKSRKQYGKKFESLGLNISEEEIFASSFAAAAYLTSINFPKDKKVYVIGEEGILKELELAGYSFLGGPEDGTKKIELKPGFMMEHDENVGAVVVGFDRYFNYYKIQYATLCIRENQSCIFIATNRDAVTHLTDAQEWAGGGSMVGAISGSTQREPQVVGKPSTFMMDYLASKDSNSPGCKTNHLIENHHRAAVVVHTTVGKPPRRWSVAAAHCHSNAAVNPQEGCLREWLHVAAMLLPVSSSPFGSHRYHGFSCNAIL